jgi:hypothetical protein
MQLEDYFEFLDPDESRIKGHRIGIRERETQSFSSIVRLELKFKAHSPNPLKWTETPIQSSISHY